MFEFLPKTHCLFCHRGLRTKGIYFECIMDHYEAYTDSVSIITSQYIFDFFKNGQIIVYSRHPLARLPESFSSIITQTIDFVKLTAPEELNDKINKLINFI